MDIKNPRFEDIDFTAVPVLEHIRYLWGLFDGIGWKPDRDNIDLMDGLQKHMAEIYRKAKDLQDWSDEVSR